MSIYYPQGLDIRQCEDFDFLAPCELEVVDYTDPTSIESPKDETAAAELVASHIWAASTDRTLTTLQWHAACVDAHPWTITETAFRKLLDESWPEDRVFDHQLHREVFLSDVAFSLEKVGDDE